MKTAWQYTGYGFAAVASYQLLRIGRKLLRWYTTPLQKLPGPKRSFLVGTFWEILKSPFMKPHFEWWKEAGDVDLIHYTGLFGGSSVMILNADYIKQLLMANYRTPQYVKKFFILQKMIGKGLVTLEGEDWHRHRRIIHPSFQVGFLKANLDQHVPSRVKRLLECWKQAGPDRVIDVSSHFSMLTLDILGEVAFAHDFCGMNTIQEWAENKDTGGNSNIDELPQVSDRLVQSMNASMKATPKRIILSAFGLNMLDQEAARTRRAMNDAVAQVVEDARLRYEIKGRTSTTPGSGGGKYSAKSVLEVLLDANDADDKDGKKGKLDDKELQDEVKTFLVAGHETTSTWCYWATYCLCQYPEIQERLYQDIISHAPMKEGVADDDIDVAMIEKMEYLDAFLKEVLRLYAPAGMVLRHNVKEEIFGDTVIPAHTRLTVPIYLVHRSPRYWKNPDVFQPERWLGDEPPYSNSYAYLPFSHGPRNCIGHRFATMEAKLIMAPILRRVRFELIPELRNTDFELTSYITVKAKPGVKVNVRFRE